jgi:Ca-activated chloride channel family protein
MDSWVPGQLSTLLWDTLREPLAYLGVDALEAPERLPWGVAAVGLAAILALASRAPALRWPATFEARRAGRRRRELVPVLAWLLRLGALACLAVVIARPVTIDESPPEPGRGLDLILVLDASASMRALDTSAPVGQFPGPPQAGDDLAHAASPSRARTRLDLAKRVVARFATARVAEGDRVGLVVFGSNAFTQCPLTNDARLLAAALDRVEVGIAGEATALGDALALAVKRAPESALTETGLGRVIVLLTDGRSNAGTIPVDVAIGLAAGERLRVHTVGIGTGGAKVPMASRARRGDQPLRFERHDTDLPTLERIAAETGGRSFVATRPGDLAAVYDEIDSLERAERARPPRIRQILHAEPLLVAAGGLLSLEIALARILRRRTP